MKNILEFKINTLDKNIHKNSNSSKTNIIMAKLKEEFINPASDSKPNAYIYE